MVVELLPVLFIGAELRLQEIGLANDQQWSAELITEDIL